MTIDFKYNGMELSHPDNPKHIDIQNTFRQKVQTLIEPFKDKINAEPTGYIVINYVEEHIDRPFIEIHGFGGDNTVKLLMLLKALTD